MKSLMTVFVGSCQKFTELNDKQSVCKLNWREQVQMHLHVSMCSACSAHRRQMIFLDHYFEKSDKELAEKKLLESDEHGVLKSRIQQSLSQS